MTTIADFLVSLGFQVDDASRSKAESSYAKYEKAVRDAEARVQAAKEAGAKASIQIALRKELDQAREAAAAAKAASTVEDAEKRKTKAQQDGARAQADAIGFAVAKFEVFIQAAEAMARGVASAVENVVTAYKELHYEAGRTGATVAGLQSIAYAFQQVGGSSKEVIGAIDAFSARLANPGLKNFIQNLGVDTKAPTEKQFLQTIEALHKQGDYNVEHQQAEMLGISEPVYKRAIQQMDELKRRQAEREATVKAMGLDEEAAGQASARLMQSFGSLTMTLQVGLDKLITDQLPRITAWFDSLTDWIKSHQPEISDFVRGLAEKMEKFGGVIEQAFKALQQGFEDGSIKKKFDEFSDTIGRVATALERVLSAGERLFNSPAWKVLTYPNPVVSWLFGGSGGGIPGVGAVGGYNPLEAGPSGSPAARKPDERTWWQRHAPKILGGKDDPNASADQRGGVFRRAARAMRGDQSDGVAANPGAYKDFLDHVARSEGTASRSGGGYNTSLDFGRWLPGGKEQDLTKLTLNQIDELQKGMLTPENRARYGNGLGSSAIGRYQIVGKTLRGLRKQLGLRGDELFDEAMQDRLAATLARGRGASASGLQQEWASLVGAKNATAVALMQKVDPKASTMPSGSTPNVNVSIRPSLPAVPKSMTGLDYLHGPGGFDVNALTRPAAPLGVNSSTSNSVDNSRTVTVSPTITNSIKVEGASDPQTAGRVIQSALTLGYNDMLENTQSALRG